MRTVKVGRDTTIHPSAVIGTDGMMFTRNRYGRLGDCEIHAGGVVIGDEVWIGANTSIQRGITGDTIIGDRTKIGHNCVIGHETVIEKDCLIVSGAIIGGYCRIRENARISLGAIIRNRITIGKHSHVGMGAVVTKDVPDYAVVYGNPAQIRGNNE